MASSGLQLSDWSPGNGWSGGHHSPPALVVRCVLVPRARNEGGCPAYEQGECHVRQKTSEAQPVALMTWHSGPQARLQRWEPRSTGRPIPPRGVVCRPRTKHLLQITTFGRWTLTLVA